MDYIEAVEKALGISSTKEFLPMQPGDVPATSADTSALESWIGFKPNTPVEEVPHIFRMGWGADYPDENNWVHEVMNSSAGANRMRRGCLDPNCAETEALEFDELTQQAKEETDPEKRVELYREAERLLAEEETAFAPIYHYTSPWMVKPYVGNWYYQPAGGQHYWEWTIDWEAKKEATGQ